MIRTSWRRIWKTSRAAGTATGLNMRYLVDGSNVLGARDELHTSGAADRLLWAIERYCERARSTALVILDGMEGKVPGMEFAVGERVRARIASAGGTSDRADRELIARIPHGERAVTLVTSDSSLAAAAIRKGARVIDSVSFVRRISPPAAPALGEKEAAAAGIDNAEFLRLWTEAEDG